MINIIKKILQSIKKPDIGIDENTAREVMSMGAAVSLWL